MISTILGGVILLAAIILLVVRWKKPSIANTIGVPGVAMTTIQAVQATRTKTRKRYIPSPVHTPRRWEAVCPIKPGIYFLQKNGKYEWRRAEQISRRFKNGSMEVIAAGDGNPIRHKPRNILVIP